VDLERLLGIVDRACVAAGSRWVVVGGVAMNAYGHARATYDFDLAAEARAREGILENLLKTGFRALNDVHAFSNLLHAEREFGRLDLMWLDESTFERVFSESRILEMGPARTVRVASPEHLVGMKVGAIANSPTRVFRDAADLQFLLAVPGIDDNRIREFFEKAGLLELLGRLRPPRG
jgi:hypothetical protein